MELKSTVKEIPFVIVCGLLVSLSINGMFGLCIVVMSESLNNLPKLIAKNNQLEAQLKSDKELTEQSEKECRLLIENEVKNLSKKWKIK